jgi:predicted O-methyltransferase YrrM
MIKKRLDKYYSQLLASLSRRNTIHEIKNHNNATVRAFAQVYQSQMEGTFSGDESFAIEKIKLLRESLLSSSEVLYLHKIGGRKEQDTSEDVLSLSIGEICSSAATPEKWGEFQFRLIRKLKPFNCLEMGTNLGISGCYILSAQMLNDSGFFVTLEGNEQLAEIASKNMKDLQLNQHEIVIGLFKDTLPEVLNKYKSFDYVFIDGHHDKEATIAYFQLIKPHLTDNSVIIFDDINWSEGMQEAWAHIGRESGIVAAFDFYKLGIVVFSTSYSHKSKDYKLFL